MAGWRSEWPAYALQSLFHINSAYDSGYCASESKMSFKLKSKLSACSVTQAQFEGSVWSPASWISLLEDTLTEKKTVSEKCNIFIWPQARPEDHIKRVYKSIHAVPSIIDHIAQYGKFWVKVLPKVTCITVPSIHTMGVSANNSVSSWAIIHLPTLAQRLMYLSWNENQILRRE